MKIGLIGSSRYENKRKIRETIFKPYKPANFFHRNKLLTKNVNVIIAFMESTKGCEGTLDIIKKAKKLDKKVVIIN